MAEETVHSRELAIEALVTPCIRGAEVCIALKGRPLTQPIAGSR